MNGRLIEEFRARGMSKAQLMGMEKLQDKKFDTVSVV